MARPLALAVSPNEQSPLTLGELADSSLLAVQTAVFGGLLVNRSEVFSGVIWEPLKTINDVAIQRASFPSDDDVMSPAHCCSMPAHLRAQIRIHAPASRVGELLASPDSRQRLDPILKHAEVVAEFDIGLRAVYYSTSSFLGGLVAQRDFVVMQRVLPTFIPSHAQASPSIRTRQVRSQSAVSSSSPSQSAIQHYCVAECSIGLFDSPDLQLPPTAAAERERSQRGIIHLFVFCSIHSDVSLLFHRSDSGNFNSGSGFVVSPLADPLTSLLLDPSSTPSTSAPSSSSADQSAFHDNRLSSSSLASPSKSSAPVMIDSQFDENACIVTLILSSEAAGSLPAALSRNPAHIASLLNAVKKFAEQST